MGLTSRNVWQVLCAGSDDVWRALERPRSGVPLWFVLSNPLRQESNENWRPKQIGQHFVDFGGVDQPQCGLDGSTMSRGFQPWSWPWCIICIYMNIYIHMNIVSFSQRLDTGPPRPGLAIYRVSNLLLACLHRGIVSKHSLPWIELLLPTWWSCNLDLQACKANEGHTILGRHVMFDGFRFGIQMLNA